MNLRSLVGAFGYFSVLPIPRASVGEPNQDIFGFLPFVGIAVGAAAGGAAYAIAVAGMNSIAVAVAFGLSIGLTGALHADGFLDACDGLLAQVPPARRLEILKDPRTGSFAIACFAIVCSLWIAALVQIAPARLPWAAAYAAGTARLAAVLNAFRFPYSRGGRVSRPALALALIALVALSLMLSTRAWVVIPCIAAFSLAGGKWAAGRLGGNVVGDVYGALIFAGEPLALALSAFALEFS